MPADRDKIKKNLKTTKMDSYTVNFSLLVVCGLIAWMGIVFIIGYFIDSHKRQQYRKITRDYSRGKITEIEYKNKLKKVG